MTLTSASVFQSRRERCLGFLVQLVSVSPGYSFCPDLLPDGNIAIDVVSAQLFEIQLFLEQSPKCFLVSKTLFAMFLWAGTLFQQSPLSFRAQLKCNFFFFLGSFVAYCYHDLSFSSLLGNSYFLYACPPPSVNHLMMFHGSLVIQVLQLLQLQKHQRLIYTVASALSCVQLCDLTDYILPGSSVHGILQARTLDWVAISFSQVSSQPRD